MLDYLCFRVAQRRAADGLGVRPRGAEGRSGPRRAVLQAGAPAPALVVDEPLPGALAAASREVVGAGRAVQADRACLLGGLPEHDQVEA